MGLSAGADVREQLDAEGRVRRMELFARLYDELTGFPKPTVAACHGSCVGGGAEIAVACDLRVGGSNLRMRFPGGALGVPVGPARLVTLCGLSVAKYLLLTAKDVSAEEALRWGLVHRVAPAAATEEQALNLAAAIAEHPPEAVARLKRMLHDWDGVEERSRAEGEGQVEWQRSGPGLPLRGARDLVAQLDHPAVEGARPRQLHRAARQAPVEQRLALAQHDRDHRHEQLVQQARVRELRRDVAAADDP